MKKLFLLGLIAISIVKANAQINSGTGGSSMILPNSPTTNTSVGIGTDKPAEKLHVVGNIKLGLVGGGSNFGIEWYTSNWGNGFGHKIYNTDPGQQTDLRIAARHNTATWTDMVTFTSTGKVGINITNPLHKFQVHDGAIMISGNVPGFGGPQLLFSDNLTTNPNGRWAIEYIAPAPSRPSMGGMNFWQPFPGGGGAGNYSLFLKNDGKIGMGVADDNTDPNFCANAFPGGYRLYVNGGILTTKVKIALYCSSQWADYVFAEGYKLKPLDEVETFIKANKHLPDVPSAEEIVQTGGIDVNQMLAKQMEKIEELTLYMIELQKQIEQLKKSNTGKDSHSVNH